MQSIVRPPSNITENSPVSSENENPLEIVRLVVYTTCSKIENHDGGWWVHLEGSWESLYIGPEVPPFREGDRIKLSIERTNT